MHGWYMMDRNQCSVLILLTDCIFFLVGTQQLLKTNKNRAEKSICFKAKLQKFQCKMYINMQQRSFSNAQLAHKCYLQGFINDSFPLLLEVILLIKNTLKKKTQQNLSQTSHANNSIPKISFIFSLTYFAFILTCCKCHNSSHSGRQDLILQFVLNMYVKLLTVITNCYN